MSVFTYLTRQYIHVYCVSVVIRSCSGGAWVFIFEEGENNMKVFTFLTLFSACSASNILLMFPMSVKSHVNSFVPLFKKLSENGHNITMVTSFKPKVQIPNCTFIMVKNIMEDYLTDSQGNNKL